MILAQKDSSLILDKPSGISTHTPDGGATEGFLEMASRLLDLPLWAVHRLDRDTSGCLLVTTKAGMVDEWSHKLAAGKKKYIFISEKKSKNTVWSQKARIEKVGNHRFDIVDGEANSFTGFAHLRSTPLGELYEAEISSGKTHQIRLHARASGIPILGDTEYGGAPFFRLMLHAQNLVLDGLSGASPQPLLFELKDPNQKHFNDLAKFLTSLDRRRFLLNFQREETDCFRLVHREWSTSKKVGLAIEKLGEIVQFLSYSPQKIDPLFIEEILKIIGVQYWFVRLMFDRGQGNDTQNVTEASKDLPIQWNVHENKMKFDLRYSQGLSSGLFLDQRNNRLQVLKTSQGKKVANFFSYTCGFSVAAALGGAHEVVSVDTSSNSLEWGKNNFKLNNLDPDKFEFFVADSIFFLNSCIKRNRKFDLIVLDPPTFSRNKKAIFRLKENLPELLEISFKCLDENGEILVTVNDEFMTQESLSRIIEKAADQSRGGVIKLTRIKTPYDFEFPTERNTVTKGYWVSLA